MLRNKKSFVGQKITDSWEEIALAIKDGTYAEKYAVGDYKPMKLTTGETVNMQIVAFDADEKASGSKAAISWLSVDLLKETRVMNSTFSNVGGWEASELRAWLQSDVYSALPDAVKDNIVAVNKTYYDYASQETLVCEDTLWIPSVREIGRAEEHEWCKVCLERYKGECYNYEVSGVSYTYCANSGVRMKRRRGKAECWWLRSAVSSNDDDFRIVNSDGKYGGYDDYACYSYGVALGFCM